jgi:hypothetical protein
MHASLAHLPDPDLHGLTRHSVFRMRDSLAVHYHHWLNEASPLAEPIPLDELYSAGNLAIAETLADVDPTLTTTDLARRVYGAIRHAILTVWYDAYLHQHPAFAALDIERVAARRRDHYAA